MSPTGKHPLPDALACASPNSSCTVPPPPFVLCVSGIKERLLVSPGSESSPRPRREVKGGSGARGCDEEGLYDTC